jgi:hypothetical protein
VSGEPALDGVENLSGALFKSFLIRVAFDVGGGRSLIRVVDAGDTVDLSGAGAFVDALEVALLADRERSMHVDFEKITDALPHFVTQSPIRGNRRDQNDHAVTGEHLGNESNPADIFVAAGFAVAEVFAEVLANDVAVEQFDAMSEGAEALAYGSAECSLSGRA